jgi:protein tyrosine phosphatase (PTP) superfamily phosphohydrolase (DUF442 family)
MPMSTLVEIERPRRVSPAAVRRWRPLLWRTALLAICATVAVEAIRVNFGCNFHVLIPNKVYRCAQLSGSALEEVVRARGIRTVVNLRGCCDPQPWYLEECRVTHKLGIAQEDISLSAGRLPSSDEMARLLEVLDHCEYPILLHCRQGKDRTGLASAAVLLLQTHTGLAEARHELGWRYGHLALGRPANLDHYFDLYSRWLRNAGQTHDQAAFRKFMEGRYCPGECRARVEPLDFPTRMGREDSTALHVRCHNTGVEAWHMSPGLNSGVHAGLVVWNKEGKAVVSSSAGLFEKMVFPGQSVDLVLSLPPLHRPGRYQVMVDLGDMRHCWFYQAGSEPLERTILVE